MTNTKLLREKINSCGYKQSFLAEKLGITNSALSCKIAGKRAFSLQEVKKLGELLGVNLSERERIFFA